VADPTKRTFFQRFKKAREIKKAQWYGTEQDWSADLPKIARQADYDTVEAFNTANPARRDGRTAVGTVEDGGVRWSIEWLVGTNEVIARAGSWVDANQTAALPELVLILGRADTEQGANHSSAQSDTLETLRDRLAG
jgi:hypothetical protein